MKVVYLKPALRDLEVIKNYIARDDADAARRVVAQIDYSAKRLINFPYSGRPRAARNEAPLRAEFALRRNPSCSRRNSEDRGDLSHVSKSAVSLIFGPSKAAAGLVVRRYFPLLMNARI
jgi:plasmid stabilization system protein ParE